VSTGRLEPEISKKSAVLVAPQQGRQTAQMRVGIFAGSFDPIHDGHLAVAKSAIGYLDLDNLYFVVEKNPWTSKKPVTIEHRRAMVDLAIGDHDRIGQLELQDERFDLQNTLPQIHALFPASELYFIFGADVFLRMDIEQWPGLAELLKHYLVVFERDTNSQDAIAQHAKELGIVVAIIPSLHPKHSSSAVRQQPHKKQVWLSDKVADYIDVNKLY